MILNNVAGTFSRAMEKLSMAEKTSDISTESDCNAAKMKRRKYAQKILSSEEDLSESDGEPFINKYKSSFSKLSQVRCGKRSNVDISSKTCATQPNIYCQSDEENICVSHSAKKLPPLPTPPQAQCNKKSTLKVNSSSKTCAIQLDTFSQNDQENINLSSNNKKPLSSPSTSLQAIYSKRSASNIASLSKTYAIQPDTYVQNDQENIDPCNVNKLSEWNTVSDNNFNSCKGTNINLDINNILCH